MGMKRLITDGIFNQFDAEGAVCLPGIVDANWLDRLRAAIERDIADPGPYNHGYEDSGDGHFHGNMRLWEHDPDFKDFCFNSILPELAAQFLQTDKINLFYDQLFVKEPGTDIPIPWHNDQPYWPVRGWPVMSFWLALDPVTQESGAVEFIKGSHRWDLWFQPKPFAKGKMTNEKNPGYEKNIDYVPMPDIDAQRDKYEFLSWDMQAGDVLAFHALTVHGSSGNTTRDRRRRGYSIRYTGNEAVYYTGPGTGQGHP